MIPVNEMESNLMPPGEIDAVFNRNDLVIPAMYDFGHAGAGHRILSGIARQIEGRRHQEQAVWQEILGGHGRDVATH